MILQPTVLILGAGASKPYGYPLGGELVDQIVEQTRPDSALSAALSHDLSLRAFHNRLRLSEMSSIDDFLESNPDFRNLGKLCIAAVLTVWGPQLQYRIGADSHWYKYLWRRLHEGAATSEDFRNNRLKIITYNYECSFERYFSGVLAHSYPDLAKAKEKQVAGFVADVLPVVHLHGTLGGADERIQQVAQPEGWLEYHHLTAIASGIRIVHEDESKEYELAHKWLQEAVNVHILGFGYHATNLRRLDLATHTQGGTNLKAFGGTAFGMEEGERTRANSAINFRGGSLHDADCLKYLRAHAILE